VWRVGNKVRAEEVFLFFLTVDALASRFGVSRTPVRDALNALVTEGLIVAAPRVGYYVIDLSEHDIREISGIRQMVELYAFEFATRKMPKARIENLLGKSLLTRSLQEAERAKAFDVLDKEFHMEIINSAGNRRLVDFYQPISSLVDLIRHLNVRVDEALEEHILVLNALKDDKPDVAKKYLEQHLDTVEMAILGMINQHNLE
jgi:DNA-binding GntR family transcriptional regulator